MSDISLSFAAIRYAEFCGNITVDQADYLRADACWRAHNEWRHEQGFLGAVKDIVGASKALGWPGLEEL